eukprot:16798-Amphidinium_carterae.1
MDLHQFEGNASVRGSLIASTANLTGHRTPRCFQTKTRPPVRSNRAAAVALPAGSRHPYPMGSSFAPDDHDAHMQCVE